MFSTYGTNFGRFENYVKLSIRLFNFFVKHQLNNCLLTKYISFPIFIKSCYQLITKLRDIK